MIETTEDMLANAKEGDSITLAVNDALEVGVYGPLSLGDCLRLLLTKKVVKTITFTVARLDVHGTEASVKLVVKETT